MTVPSSLTTVTLPLQWKEWEDCLRNHRDWRFATYITSGIREGFRVGYDYQTHRFKKAEVNMRSALEHPQVVQEYLARECSEGRILGPFAPQALPGVQVWGDPKRKRRLAPDP